MAKKTYNEKLNSPGDLPKIEDALIADISDGKLITTDRVRAYLAAQAGADATCPLTAGIFTNICAHASEERETDKIPWWRVLKANGELNDKFPEGQKLLLEADGHTIIQKGKRWFVADYERSLYAPEE